MKKLLAVFLAAAMLLCFAAAAFAATNENSAEQKAATERLHKLGIMQGDPNGAFRPQNQLTRAEFAKIAVITAGLKAEAEAKVNEKPALKDVKNNAWYTGYINAAYEHGLIKGYEDATFRPTQNISEREVLTVVLRLLGYEKLSGTWPENYLNLAEEQGLLIHAGNGTGNAVRIDIAVLVHKALDKTVVTWNSTTQKYEAQKNAKGENFTLLMKVQAAQEIKAAGIYYGIVLDYTLNGKEMNTLTVFTEQGKTVVYPVASGIYAELRAEQGKKTGLNAVQKGSFIKYATDANGKIIKDHTANYAIDSDGKGDTALSSKTLVFNGRRYTLANDARIFNLTQKNGKLSVELLSLNQALSSNILYGDSFKPVDAVQYVPAMAAMLPSESAGRTLDNLVLANYGLSRGTAFGFVKEAGFKDSEGKDMVSFYGDAVSYQIAGSPVAGIARGKLYDCYKSGDGALKLVELKISDFRGDDPFKQEAIVMQESSGLLNVKKLVDSAPVTQYEITEKTVFYEYNWSRPGDDDPVYTDGVEVGDRIFLLTNTDGEALLIIIDKTRLE